MRTKIHKRQSARVEEPVRREIDRGAKLRDFRNHYKLSQRVVAPAIGKSREWLQMVEVGRIAATDDRAKRIIEAIARLVPIFQTAEKAKRSARSTVFPDLF
jgi:predicted transcriptional regulator